MDEASVDIRGSDVFKGERIYASLSLPDNAVLKRTAKVVVEAP